MSTATAEQEPKTVAPIAKPWRMPEAGVGQTVLWHPSGLRGDREPLAAIASQVNHRSLSLHIMDAESSVFKVRACVRHVDDPEAKDDDRLDNGAWEYTKDTLRLIE